MDLLSSIPKTNSHLMKNTVLENPPAAEAPAERNNDRNPDHYPERSSEYAIYKPNSRGSGGVIRFGLNRSKGAIFVDAASQDNYEKQSMAWGHWKRLGHGF